VERILSPTAEPLHLHLPSRLVEVCSKVPLLCHFNLDSYQSVISIVSTRTDSKKSVKNEEILAIRVRSISLISA